MRIGEIKQIIVKAVGSDDTLALQSEAIYGGQAYRVTNFGEVMRALDILSKQSWNTLDYTTVESLKAKFNNPYVEVAQLGASDYNVLNSYISDINTKLPIYLGTIKSLTEDQDEKAINIKLPDHIKSLDELTKLNKSLETIFKEFNIDGGVQFVGFDKGTDWYVLCIVGVETYHVFIGCLQVSQEFFKARAEYYKSEKAKLDYEAARMLAGQDTTDKISDEKAFKKFQEDRMELELREKVKHVLKEVTNTNGHSQPELQNKIIMATKQLVEALGDNVEFHLSLNPPAYASETAGQLTIDYNSIRAATISETKVAKQIAADADSKVNA